MEETGGKFTSLARIGCKTGRGMEEKETEGTQEKRIAKETSSSTTWE